MERGEASDKMLMSAVQSQPFEKAGVPDTVMNRELYSQMVAEIGTVPDGTIVDVPGE